MNTKRMLANMRRNLEINQRLSVASRNFYEFRIEMSEATLDTLRSDLHVKPTSYVAPAFYGAVIVINDSLPYGDFNILKVMR